MTFITGNNATATLASDITNVATSLTVTSGQGARFPTVAAPDVLMLTLDDGTNIEVVTCTVHTAASDTFTIIRAQEQVRTSGPTAFAFTANVTTVEARLTKGMVEHTEPIRIPFQNLNPSTAAPSGSMYVFARSISGRGMLKWMGPAGVDYSIQPTIFDNQVLLYRAGVSHVTGSGIGGLWAYGGSTGQLLPMSPTWSGSISGSMRRSRLVTAATSGSNIKLTAYAPSGSGFVWRGTTVGAGGFFFHSRIWDPSGSSHLGRLCVGLGMDTGSVLQGSMGGLQQSPNSILFGYHETGSYGGYAAYRIGMVGTGSLGTTKLTTTPTSRSLGNLLDIFMFAAPNSNGIQVRVDKINSDGTSTTIHDELFTTFLPLPTALLSPRVELQASAAISSAIEVSSIYLESDF
jgi:hypothetical protein